MASETPEKLSVEQLQALFDILNHNETYREAESFKHGYAIRQYGYPFTRDQVLQPGDTPQHAPESSSPLLQLLLTKCLLTVPSMSDLPVDFWPTHFQSIMGQLADANLSESYDKGTLGTRKTLATGASVIHEAVTRGLLSGVPKRADGERIDLKKATYDTTQAADLKAAWNDCVEDLIYGNLTNELFDHVTQTRDFESHSPAVAAAGQYVIVHLAALLHHIFVLSHEGPYLLKLIENVYKLVPFSAVRQTFRIGNAATMISGLVRIFLAKMSVGGVTNWLGLTSGAADGMNLLQRIISLVLSWDASEFRKQASQIESSKERPTKEQLAALQSYLAQSADAHRALREISITQGKSIVIVILEATDPKLATSLTDAQHTQCLEWLAAQLSARDRDEITRVFCRSHPDHLTAALRSAVATYDPLIRVIHAGVDLREHVVSAIETFMADFIETSRPKKAKGSTSSSKNNNGGGWRSSSKKGTTTPPPQTTPPSVEDYVALMNRNKGLLYTYLHEVAKNCPDLREQFRTWAHGVVSEFRQSRAEAVGAGAASESLQALYASLSADQREAVLPQLNAHAVYLSKLNDLSTERMQRVLDSLETSSSGSSSESSSPRRLSGGDSRPSMAAGPGVYLMRWESLLDATVITPAAQGGVRTGHDVKGLKAGGKTTPTGEKGGGGGGGGALDAGALARAKDANVPAAPDVSVVMDALGDGFRGMVNGKIKREGAVTGLEKTSGEMKRVEGDDDGMGQLIGGVEGVAVSG